MAKEKTKSQLFFENLNNSENTANTDSYSSNDSYESFYAKLEATRKKREEEQRLRDEKARQEPIISQQEAAKKQAIVDYYNANKETMVQNRTNSLIYDYDLKKAGGRNYDYNGAVDTDATDLKTKLGVQELNVDNFLVKKQEADNQAKLDDYNKKQEIFKNPLGLNNQSVNPVISSPFALDYQSKVSNPYLDDINTFNEALNAGEIRKAQNAIQRINSRYFGADYSDGLWASLGDMIFGTEGKDGSKLIKRFDNNVEKLTTINDTITKTTDEKVLAELQNQKNQLEFENQLIQYNRLTYLEAESLNIKDMEQHLNNIEKPFENAANMEIDNTNLFTTVTSSLNKGLQYIGAGANYVTEGSFGALGMFVKDDQDEGLIREASGVVFDTATYLVPYVGQARLALTVTKDASIIAPGLGNMTGGEYESSVLGKDPNAMNTLGASLDIAAVYASNKIFGKIKANFGLEGQSQFYQKSAGDIIKTLGIDMFSEGAEEFVQTYADQMMYNESFGINDLLDKKYFVQALQNAGTAAILTGGLSVAGSYSNNVTSDNILIRTDDTKTIGGLLNKDVNSKNSQIDTPSNLQKSIFENLNNNKIVTIMDPNALDYDKVEVQNVSNIVSTETMLNSGNSIIKNLTDNGININNLSDKDSKTIQELDTNVKAILSASDNPDTYNKIIEYINELSNASSSKQAISIFNSLELESSGLTLEQAKSLYSGISTLNRSMSTKIADVSVSNLSAYENIRSIIVPSVEMETYIKSINPNIDTLVLNPKDANFGENLQSYLDGQSKFGIKPRKTASKDMTKTTLTTKTSDDISSLVSDIQTDLELEQDMKDIVVDFNVNNSTLNDSSNDSLKANIKSQMIDALPKNLTAKKAQKHFKNFSDNLEKIMPTDKKSQIYLSDANGNNIVFAKTGSNTYETSNKVDSEGKLLANVRSNGKVLNGNLTIDANFSKKEINAVNKLSNTLKLEGNLLNDKSTAKDVLKLINKNPEFSKEILQALGYDGIISGKKKLKYTSAHDDSDNINMSIASDVLTIKAKDMLNNHKSDKDYIPKAKDIKPETMSDTLDSDNKKIDNDSYISKDKDSEYFSPDIVQEFRNINITDKKAKSKINGLFDYFYSAFVDTYHRIVKDAKSINDLDVQNAISNLYTLENRHYNNANIAQTNYKNEPIGKSIKQIFAPIKGKENKMLFDKTMRLLLNAERLDNGMDAIFPGISAEKSRYAAEKVLNKHPEFKQAIDDIRVYNNNSLDSLVDAGLITPALSKALKEKYKYYVPIYSADPVDYHDIGSDSWFKSIAANDTIQDVTKAGKNFISIEESMRRKDYQQLKATLKNDVMKTIANSRAGTNNPKMEYEIPKTVYRSSNSGVNQAKTRSVEGARFYSTSQEISARYSRSGETKTADLTSKITNPLIIDGNGKLYKDIEFEGKTYRTDDIVAIAKDRGYDGVIFKNIIDSGPFNHGKLSKFESDVIVTLEANHKKETNIYAGHSGVFNYFENGELKKFNTHSSYAEALGTQRVDIIDKFFNLPIINMLPKIQKVKRKMITTYDPIFQLNNIARDFQETALFNTKYPTKFMKNYVRAIYNMSAKTELFHEFQKTGIITYDSKNKISNVTNKMEALPKFAEYISSLDSGKTATEAKIESQGANLNFARHGWLGGQLNDSGFMFLNASIQGADKAISTGVGLVRGANTPAGFGRLVLTLGVAATPGLINALLNEDDEDYAKLPYYYKNNYYFIKQNNGEFIRIPKGRVTAFLDTISRYAFGISKESSAGNYFESLKAAASSSIIPAELSEAAPWATFNQIINNENFFGGEIYEPHDPAEIKAEKISKYLITDFFGRYSKTIYGAIDDDATTDILSQSSFIFNSTKYNKDIGTIYELNDYYNGLNKDTMDFETRIQKKYINTKIAALNSVRGEINDMKENQSTIDEMRPTYQSSDYLVRDILANYKNYYEVDDGDVITIYFDDETFTYNKAKDEFRKVK